ncbi:MAG: hypothetical protein PHG12_08900 [Sphaerochaeta sp.]|nr:hypothetical protein [Sphaerochaeta sp.]
MQLSSIGLPAISLTGLAIAPIIALVGAVVIAVIFLNPKKQDRFEGWKRKLSAHLNFEHYLLSSILKFLYAFCVLYSVVYGITLMISAQILMGLVTLVLGPVVVRMVFEQIMLLLSIRDESARTNELLLRMQERTPPPPRPMPPQQGGYPPRQGGYAPGYGGQPRQAPEGNMSQRYAPVPPNSGYPTPGTEAPHAPAPGGTGRHTPQG